MRNPPKCLGGNLGDLGGFCKGVRPSETQKIGVSDGLFSRNLFGIILGSLGIIIVGLCAETFLERRVSIMKHTTRTGRSWLRLRTVVKIILTLFLLLVN